MGLVPLRRVSCWVRSILTLRNTLTGELHSNQPLPMKGFLERGSQSRYTCSLFNTLTDELHSIKRPPLNVLLEEILTSADQFYWSAGLMFGPTSHLLSESCLHLKFFVQFPPRLFVYCWKIFKSLYKKMHWFLCWSIYTRMTKECFFKAQIYRRKYYIATWILGYHLGKERRSEFSDISGQ